MLRAVSGLCKKKTKPKKNKLLSKTKETLINLHSTDKLTDEMGTLGNTGQLRKVNSCCYVRLQFAENFKIPSLSQKHVHNYITTITAYTKNNNKKYIYI